MKELSLSYKILVSVCLVFIAAVLTGYFYFLRPLQLEAEEKKERVEEMVSDLVSRGWPTAPVQLFRLQEEKQKRLVRLHDKREQSEQRSQNTFSEQLEKKFGSVKPEDREEFINYVTRLDYQEYYSETLKKWETHGITLHPAVFNLHEDSVSRHVYRQVLQLWTVDAVLELIHESGFSPMLTQLREFDDETVDAGTENKTDPEMVSQVSVEPVYEYKSGVVSEETYLLELPVKTRVRGTTENLERLINRLRAKDSWILLKSVEISKLPTRHLEQPDDKLEILFELSTLYPL